jgi:hypothetical protein
MYATEIAMAALVAKTTRGTGSRWAATDDATEILTV